MQEPLNKVSGEGGGVEPVLRFLVSFDGIFDLKQAGDAKQDLTKTRALFNILRCLCGLNYDQLAHFPGKFCPIPVWLIFKHRNMFGPQHNDENYIMTFSRLDK